MAGLSSNGLVIRTREEIGQLIRLTIRESLRESGEEIDLDTSIEGILIDQVAADLGDQWEALEALYTAFQGRAVGANADWYANITGTRRRAATRTFVLCTVNLDGGKSLAAGKVAALDGDPDSQFYLVEGVTNPGGSPADIDATFACLKTGPVVALATKLSVIVTPSTGWNSITNAADGAKGRAAADDPELALTRIVELASRGSRTAAAIRARVSKVSGVLSVTVYENQTSSTVGGRPAKSFEVVVWDGLVPGATDNAIAQAIFDVAPEGIQAYGTATGNAIDGDGDTVAVAFTRASVLRTYVAATVTEATCSAAQIKAAAFARGELFVVGELGSYDEMIQALRDALPSTIGRITDLKIDVAATPATTVVTPTYAQIIRIATVDVTVTGVS